MPKSFHASVRPAGPVPSMFLVLQWQPGTLPEPRPRVPRPVVPPAPERQRMALAAIDTVRADSVRADGVATLADIARALNDQHVPTLSGRGVWHGAQVARAECKRLG